MATEQQVDLFLDSVVNAPLRQDRALLEFPFFSLEKRPRMTPMEFHDGKVSIRIEPGAKGVATIWDKDVLIYVVSLLNDRLERGAPVDRKVQFAAHDLLTLTGRGTGKRAYELLLDALDRLRSTHIKTTIEAADQRERRGFGWIETYRVVERDTQAGKRVMTAIEVTLNEWMFRALVQERRVLAISRDYFGLTGGLERRLYELARKHLGNQQEWTIGLAKLADKVGTVRPLKLFASDLRRIIDANNLPTYRISLITPIGRRNILDRATVLFEPRLAGEVNTGVCKVK